VQQPLNGNLETFEAWMLTGTAPRFLAYIAETSLNNNKIYWKLL